MQTQPSGPSSKMYVSFPLCSTRLDTDNLQEKRRQKHFINLIPSENFTSQAVLEALGSVMQSTYQARTWHESYLTSCQTNTLKAIQEHDIMVEMNSSMKQKDYVNLAHYRR